MSNPLQKLLSLWGRNHYRAITHSLAQLSRHLWSSILTFFTLGLCLAIPLGLYSLTTALKPMANDWQDGARLSIFLKKSISETEQQALMNKLARSALVSTLRYESPTEVLENFQNEVNLPEVVEYLPENPLPGVITFIPNTADAEAIQTLKASLLQESGIEDVVVDLDWVLQLQALMATLKTASVFLGILFGLMAIFVVQNTLRLSFTKHQEDIRLLSLIGATRPFIRRPFLYRGVWIGFGSSIIALCVLWSGLYWFAQKTQFPVLLQGFSVIDTFLFILIGATLGWIGARLATLNI